MLRFLLIVFLLSLVLYKVGTAIMRVLSRSAGANRHDRSFSEQEQRRKPAGGNVNIDYVPGKKNEKGKKFEGGEYVDYEEVK